MNAPINRVRHGMIDLSRGRFAVVHRAGGEQFGIASGKNSRMDLPSDGAV